VVTWDPMPIEDSAVRVLPIEDYQGTEQMLAA
jgi:hypothetical protein